MRSHSLLSQVCNGSNSITPALHPALMATRTFSWTSWRELGRDRPLLSTWQLHSSEPNLKQALIKYWPGRWTPANPLLGSVEMAMSHILLIKANPQGHRPSHQVRSEANMYPDVHSIMVQLSQTNLFSGANTVWLLSSINGGFQHSRKGLSLGKGGLHVNFGNPWRQVFS